MPASPGDDVGWAVAVDKRLGNDETRTQRARGGLGWNTHAIIDPFSILEMWHASGTISQVNPGRRTIHVPHVTRTPDRNALAAILAALTHDSNLVSKGRSCQ